MLETELTNSYANIKHIEQSLNQKNSINCIFNICMILPPFADGQIFERWKFINAIQTIAERTAHKIYYSAPCHSDFVEI